ncbi:MAG: hypothetical protein HZC12_09060 [Nitrospirae bacterium]|nr:hypothetical protein [Nitrospirota bacterium]
MKFWYVVYTKPRQEELVVENLKRVPEIEVVNPKLKKKKIIHGRLREIIEELFPCYVFTKFNLKEHYRLIKYTRGVRRILGNDGVPFIVDDGIIEVIKSRTKDGFAAIEPPEFKPGEQVLIKDGPLSGLTGIFEYETRASDRVMILLNAISYQAKLTIDKCLLSKA